MGLHIFKLVFRKKMGQKVSCISTPSAILWFEGTKHPGKGKGFGRLVVLAGLQRGTATTLLGFGSWWLHLHMLHH